jgi:hypothetical protein
VADMMADRCRGLRRGSKKQVRAKQADAAVARGHGGVRVFFKTYKMTLVIGWPP